MWRYLLKRLGNRLIKDLYSVVVNIIQIGIFKCIYMDEKFVLRF